ncbi:MAG: glycosyltransferase [Alphaproteobacteria bacterium]|nr:glycosyltransferase [Alphaproteobacteria bacterium]
MTQRKLISIISPCYNERNNVRHCYEAMRAIFEDELAAYDYEHIFADNASQDGTLDELREIAKQDKRVKVIANARNYGPFRSNFNALRASHGAAVLVMLPVDLQDPPELIPQFVREWERGYKIVYGQRIERDEGLILRAVRKLYYRMISALADFDIPIDTAEFQLLDRRVADALLKFHDHYPYIRGMIANVGFRDQAKAIPYKWRARARGMSKNRLRNLFDQGLNGLVSFSTVPMRMATIIGFILAAGAILYAIIQLAINVIYRNAAPPGIATLIVALFFFSGVQLLFIGLLGEYVGAIHTQVRQGAIVIERERINLDEPAEAEKAGDST